VAVSHLYHIPAIQILHGFQCFVAVGYEAEEQASFRRFQPDQKARFKGGTVLKRNIYINIVNVPKRRDGGVCSMQQECSEIDVQIWPGFPI